MKNFILTTLLLLPLSLLAGPMEKVVSTQSAELQVIKSSLKFVGGRFINTSGGTYIAGTPYPFDAHDTTSFPEPSGVTNSGGVFTVEVDGFYDITVVLATLTSGWSGFAQIDLSVNRGSGFVQEGTPDRLGYNGGYKLAGSDTIYLKEGDSFYIMANSNSSINPAPSTTYINILKRNILN